MNTHVTLTHMARKGLHTQGYHPRAVRLFGRAFRNKNGLQKLLGQQIRPLLQINATRGQRSHHAGLCVLEVNQIHGTLNRAEDFDYDFHPLQESDKDRWCSVATAMISGIDLPPIEVIQVGQDYFVKDGHHRISVARAMGFRYIDAIVNVWSDV